MRTRSVYRSALPLAVLFACVVAVVALADDKIELRLRLPAGKSYSLDAAWQWHMVRHEFGEVAEHRVSLSIGFRCDVDDVDQTGTMTLRLTCERLRLKVDTPSVAFSYDSSEAPDDTDKGAAGLGVLLGESFSARVTNRGAILEVTGLRELVERLLLQADIPAEVRVIGESFLLQQDKLSAALGKPAPVFPEEPVGVGDSWQVTSKEWEGLELNVRSTYALIARKEGAVTIKGSRQVSVDPESDVFKAMGSDVSITVSGEGRSMWTLSEAEGLLLDGSVEDLRTMSVGLGFDAEGVAEGVGEELKRGFRITTTATFKGSELRRAQVAAE